MLQDQFVSVTDLRTKTKQALEGLTDHHKVIIMNNKPVAVIMSVEEFDKHFPIPKLRPMLKAEITPKLRKKAEAAINMSKDDLLEL